MIGFVGFCILVWDGLKKTCWSPVIEWLKLHKVFSISLGLILYFFFLLPVLAHVGALHVWRTIFSEDSQSGFTSHPWSSWLSWFDYTNTGNIGETIGGITGPFLSLITIYYVYQSFQKQSDALADQVEANRIAKREYERASDKQAQAIVEQKNANRIAANAFEHGVAQQAEILTEQLKANSIAKSESDNATFFQMFQALRDFVAELRFYSGNTYSDKRALDYFAKDFNDYAIKTQEERNKVSSQDKEKLYVFANDSWLIASWAFSIFDFVIKSSLNEEQKERFYDLLRQYYKSYLMVPMQKIIRTGQVIEETKVGYDANTHLLEMFQMFTRLNDVATTPYPKVQGVGKAGNHNPAFENP